MSKRRRKINKKAILTLIVTITLIIGLIGSTIGLFVLGSMLQDKPNLEIDNLLSKESSRIYDKDGNLIADVGMQIRTNISYNDLPEALVDAFVATEDSRYFQHNGFDYARFIKAILENIKQLGFAQGGSTFTMQLIKQSYFVDDNKGINAPKKIKRKVQEIALAMDLSSKVDKKRTLELYLNKLNFGGSGNIRGVQKAAQYYYKKDVSELTLAESALLAGIINAPTTYNPFRNLDFATKRRNNVLDLMVRHGYITKKEAALTKTIKVEDLLHDPNKVDSNGKQEYAYQSYIDTAIQEAKSLTGLDPLSVSMDIYTYMDPKVQTTMDDIQAGKNEKVKFPDDLMELAMLSLNNQTGEIVAIGGGRNYGRGGSMLLNHATDQFNQPGSAVKPILSYALAFEHLGWATSHVVLDKPIVYSGTTKLVRNFDRTYSGQVTLMDAIGKSLNTTAIITLEDIVYNIEGGRDLVINYLQSLGFSKVNKDNFDLGYAIGGSSFLTSVKELASAEAIAMNGGNYIEPHLISKIDFRNGNPSITPTYEKKQVLSPESAYLVSELMYATVNGPYFNYMQLLKRDYPVYGKTGTTNWGREGLKFNIPQGSAKDKWMVAQTSAYTSVVWIGYEKGVKDKDTYFKNAVSRQNIPGHMSNALLSVLNDEIKPPAVTRPEGVENIQHIISTFPYASTIEGMDPAFIANGLIKSEFNKLVDPQTIAIDELTSFNVKFDTNGTTNLTWSKYPDPSKLSVANDVIDMSLQVGNSWLESYGKRLFDYSWILGPIRYKAQIKQNDAVIQDIVSEVENTTIPIKANPGETYTVCGFYAFEKLGTRSNEICQELKINDINITLTIPSKTTSKEDIEKWVNDNGLIYQLSEVVDKDKAKTNEIIYNGVVMNEQSIQTTFTQKKNINFEIKIYVDQ